jgi:predicted RNA binding protein YcfA (HicA-like mRNA interferase family)
MSKYDKLIKKLLESPTSLRYSEIEKILIHFKFQKKQAKGSHVKFKHIEINDIIIPVHKNDCKDVYKKYVKNIIKINFI